MKRFYDNDNDNDDENPEFQDSAFGEEDESYANKQDIIEIMHMDIAQSELIIDILDKAINIAEKSVFWRFRGVEYKTQKIEAVYNGLMKITARFDE